MLNWVAFWGTTLILGTYSLDYSYFNPCVIRPNDCAISHIISFTGDFYLYLFVLTPLFLWGVFSISRGFLSQHLTFTETVLAVYRVQLITWCQRAKNFEISKYLAKFGLNCGTNDTFCHNFGLKMKFIRVWLRKYLQINII